MIGVFANVLAVLAGGTVGLVFRRGIPGRVIDAIMLGLGLCVVYIGIDGALEGSGALVAILSVAPGAAIGTLLDIDGALNRLGDLVSARLGGGESGMAEAFVTACLLFCVGALTIVGSLTAGLTGDNSLLFTKAVLDLISSMVLAASLGFGVILAAGFVLVLQGGIVLLAGFLSPLLNDAAIADMTCVGSLLIVAIGLNMLGITKIKVSDYTPAIFIAPFVSGLMAMLG
ncbi:MAG: DUF554 domain-containing protein [Candidatus Heteroscillospira sp.]|jgi:uncharacterized membrane protein YqgA involved in biofilm formation